MSIKQSYKYKDPTPTAISGQWNENAKLEIKVKGDRATVRQLRNAWFKALASIGE